MVHSAQETLHTLLSISCALGDHTVVFCCRLLVCFRHLFNVQREESHLISAALPRDVFSPQPRRETQTMPAETRRERAGLASDGPLNGGEQTAGAGEQTRAATSKGGGWEPRPDRRRRGQTVGALEGSGFFSFLLEMQRKTERLNECATMSWKRLKQFTAFFTSQQTGINFGDPM